MRTTTETTTKIHLGREEIADMLSKYLIGNNFGTIQPEDIVGASYDLLGELDCLTVTVKGEPWKHPNGGILSGEPTPDSG